MHKFVGEPDLSADLFAELRTKAGLSLQDPRSSAIYS